ncbi:MAG: glutathione S-transferase family protein [Proteobacteria bacterium]|nr:glutathione S-transferase family protein [Pseudomonadota bacterium]
MLRAMIHLYGRHTSYNVQKVLWLLDEIGLPYQHSNLGGTFGGLDTDTFGQLNPHRRVPVLTDGPTTVWESHAIIRYLAATYSPAGLWPVEARERAIADQWMEWATNSLMPAFGRLFWGYYRTPETQRNHAAIEATIKELTVLYRTLDDQLDGRAFLVGDALTMADIPAGTSLYRYFEMGLTVERPANVWRWYESLRMRPAYQERVMDPFEELYGRLAY